MGWGWGKSCEHGVGMGTKYFNFTVSICKGPFIATQLNSTQLDVELSTRSQREQLSPISSERRDPVRVSIATQLNSTPLHSTSS